MQSRNGSLSISTQQLVAPAAGNHKGLLSGGVGGGDKPQRHPGHMKSLHELDGAGRSIKRPSIPTVIGGDEYEPFQCSFCESFFVSQEDLHCHIRRCHVPHSWRHGREEAPGPPPSVAGSNPSSSIPTGKKGPSMLSKHQPPSQRDTRLPPQKLQHGQPSHFPLT